MSGDFVNPAAYIVPIVLIFTAAVIIGVWYRNKRMAQLASTGAAVAIGSQMAAAAAMQQQMGAAMAANAAMEQSAYPTAQASAPQQVYPRAEATVCAPPTNVRVAVNADPAQYPQATAVTVVAATATATATPTATATATATATSPARVQATEVQQSGTTPSAPHSIDLDDVQFSKEESNI